MPTLNLGLGKENEFSLRKLYRKGEIFIGCCWFTDVREAIDYEGVVPAGKFEEILPESENIYRLILPESFFSSYFIENGIGYKVNPIYRGNLRGIEFRARLLGNASHVRNLLEDERTARWI